MRQNVWVNFSLYYAGQRITVGFIEEHPVTRGGYFKHAPKQPRAVAPMGAFVHKGRGMRQPYGASLLAHQAHGHRRTL